MEHEKKHHEQKEEQLTDEVVHHHKKRSHKKTVALLLAALAILIIGGLTWLYAGKLSSAKEKVFKVIPLPAAIVDNKPVSAKSVIERVALAKQFMDAQGTGDRTNPSETYTQLIENKKFEAVASKRKVSATSEEINEEYKSLVDQYAQGDEAKFNKELSEAYKMSADEFKKEVIQQQVLQSNLLIWYNSQEELNKDSYALAKDLQSKISSGQSFDEVARAYTQDGATKDFAGDSGVIPFSDLLPEFRDHLTDSKAGDVKLVASRFGLHILKVVDSTNNAETGEKQIHLQQIFVKQSGFSEWLKSETERVKVVQLLQFA
jgi:parvulin-like peptidyl-prolyl isomerase